MTGGAPPDGDRWTRVNDLFHRALDLPAVERAAFLEHACPDDATLVAEVTSLLAAHERAETFIEQPAAADRALAALAAASARQSGLAHQRLGHYDVMGVLGTGGMGVVYLARDTRLGRLVALKAIAPEFANDPTRRERLRREARAAAALNHPGIATVYALEEIDEHLLIASEYVAGETLRTEIERGALGMVRAEQTVTAIARALAEAHARGIVHRDLKPENVVRSLSGEVKVLDFGVARFSDPSMPANVLTGDGTRIGTPAYMSPEQIRGGPVDGRSDVFSLGVLLYELAFGVHPFEGPNPTATVARILEAAPANPDAVPGSRTGESATARIWLVASRCLQKAPAARFQSMSDLVDALDGSKAWDADTASASTAPAIWWWQFHQAAATLGYCVLLIPLWRVHDVVDGTKGLALFLPGLVAVIVAGTLRMHLWFAARLYPAEWHRQRRHSAPWILGSDWLFVAVLLVAGIAAAISEVPVAILLIAAAAASLVSFAVIEPATTRAAFRSQVEPGGSGPGLQE